MALSINLEDHYNYTLVEIEGKVDAMSAKMLDRALESATFDGNRHLVLDCSHLSSISSEGLRVLMNARTQLARFHSLTLCNVSSAVASLFKLCGITRYIPLVKGVDEAEALLYAHDAALGKI
ncbi:STAS domain-containing protein [Endozoicomonas montiporae]|uniref:Anti-sigma factor antagonist n=1 Tax=Endozoicomonas montiporae CL-33 TaxID=570277 RepID=A0A142BFF5_9GAMM|nr:STAS domain-containing protein [Endozoicomonas montiporae]AMO57481.1 anti-sigma F factor antagonist [Endozoicomonas montiporae CL-33]